MDRAESAERHSLARRPPLWPREQVGRDKDPAAAERGLFRDFTAAAYSVIASSPLTNTGGPSTNFA